MEDRPLDEPALIERAKRGDVAAYERIVSEHQTIAFRTAWTITGSAADAEEAAQDAFVNGAAPQGAGSGWRCAQQGSVARTTRSRRPSRRSSAPNAAASCWQPSSASGRPTGR